MGFSCGIIGLPNVGKSTIFNALTSARALVANYPFCTIEPNTGAVAIPDPRLDQIAALAQCEKIVPTQITFLDIAGLIKGASKGEGLGNRFLAHIRNVDAIIHVVRCFDDPEVVHVEPTIEPKRDIDTIETELLLADLEDIQTEIQRLEKVAKAGDKEAQEALHLAQELEEHISAGHPARSFKAGSKLLPGLCSTLLTSKPTLFVANVAESDILAEPGTGASAQVDAIHHHAAIHFSELVVISGKVEAEIAEMPLAERHEYLEALGLQTSGLERLAWAGYRLLGLVTFFTTRSSECHAWTIKQGTKAPQAAGRIHTDFERGFIRAEVIGCDDYLSLGGEHKARELGKMRVEGKDYVVQDGDVIHFRFNV